MEGLGFAPSGFGVVTASKLLPALGKPGGLSATNPFPQYHNTPRNCESEVVSDISLNPVDWPIVQYVLNDQWTAASAWVPIFLGCCSWASWAKGSPVVWPLTGLYMTVLYVGMLKCSVAVSPFAPPTYGWLCRPCAGAVHSFAQCYVELRLNYLSTMRLATCSKEKICSHAYWQDVVYVQQWGSSNAALPTFRIPLKHD